MSSSLIPGALPDECLYSVAAAYTARWHQAEAKAARVVLGSATRLARDLPSNLNEVASNLPPEFGLSGRDLALHHSSLPLHLPFVQPSDRERLIELCCSKPGIHLRLGLAPAKATSASSLRLCVDCLRADLENYGRAYWHRVHQLPGVVACPCHGTPLSNTIVRPEATRCLFVEPDVPLVESTIIIPKAAKEDARWLAKHTLALLQKHSLAPGREKLWAFYVQEATRQGYAMPNSSIATTQLYHDFLDRFGREFLGVLGCADTIWLKGMFRRPRAHQQPLRHLLLCLFFGVEIHDALIRASALTPVSAVAGDHPNRIKTPERLVRLLPAKREAWSEARKVFGPTARDRAAPIYAWLHRNDRAWLHSTRGQRRTREPNFLAWAERDIALVDMIKAAKRAVLVEPGTRASRSLLARRVGHWSWLAKDHPLLPLACATIKQESESAVEYAIRRITAYVREHGRVDAPWRLRVACGISTRLAGDARVTTALKEGSYDQGKPSTVQETLV